MSDKTPATDSKSIFDLVSMTELEGMGAESGYEEVETSTVRISGFLSLLFGLSGWVAILNSGAITVSLAAIFCGLIALRPVKLGRVSGLKVAKVGLFLGVAFTLCGFFVPYFKTQTLGAQAERFTQRYIEVVSAGHEYYGIELLKDYRNRFSIDMPLAPHYRELKKRMVEAGKYEPTNLDNFRNNVGNQLIAKEGPDGQWSLERPVRIFHQFHIDRAEVVMVNEGGNKKVRFFLQCLIDSNDVGQWHVQVVEPYRERIVAESIL